MGPEHAEVGRPDNWDAGIKTAVNFPFSDGLPVRI